MPALPSRNIRNVETDTPETRPRDAAIRKAANDNSKDYGRYTSQNIRNIQTASNDNRGAAYQTVDQSFIEKEGERTIQPTLSQTSSARNANVQYQKGVGGSTRASAQIRSAVSTKSRTGARPSLKRAIPNVPILDVNPIKLAKATSVSITNLSWGMGLWAGIQLPLAAISIVLFGVTYIVEDVIKASVKGAVGETLYNIGASVFSSIGSAIESVFGINLVELLNPANYFIATHFLVFIVGLATIILSAIIYQISLINCFFGKHAALKIGTLIFAVFGYMVPVLNIIPWFIFWILVVWRYPE